MVFQLAGVKESEDGNVGNLFVRLNVVKWALYREKVQVGSLHIQLQEQWLTAIIRILARKEPMELNRNISSSDFETKSHHCWTTV